MRKLSVVGAVLGSVLQLVACGGGGGTTSTSPPPVVEPPPPPPPPPPAATKPEWTRYFGAHYTLTPNNSTTRDWARGGLRDPGGNRVNYQIAADGMGGYTDTGLTEFMNTSLAVIDELLADGRYAVVTVGGVTTGNAAVFFDSMDTTTGREAYQQSLYNRIDAIRALAHASGWEQKIYFQFGNEIQNVNGYYGAVCNWVTSNATSNCDLATQFVPAYVERYLAPGVESLEAKSQTLFGRPDAIRMVLGSIVNLASRESFLDTLLDYQVQGTYAPSMAGKRVYELVDTISIHYTIGGSTWRTGLDNFRNTYVPGGVPVGRVHRIWATEEVGANTAEQGYGMAAVLHGVARYLSWWQANNMGPDDGHMFVWGADIDSPTGGTCTGCTSVDNDMPVLTNFTGNRAMIAQTSNLSTVTGSANVEMHEFVVEGVDKRVVILFSSDLLAGNITAASLNLSGWSGKSVAITAYQFATQGAAPIVVTPSAGTVGTVPLNVNLSVTLGGRDAVLLLIEGTN